MNKSYLIYLVVIAFMSFTTSSQAYLDPGTGSIILQAILGFIAAGIATLSLYYNKVKSFFSRKSKKEELQNSNSIENNKIDESKKLSPDDKTNN